MVVLTLGLVGFAFTQIVPAGTVHAADETHPALSSAGPSDKEAVPLTHSAQPVVFVVTGLVCVLFGIAAISPLLIDDPAQSSQEFPASRDVKPDREPTAFTIPVGSILPANPGPLIICDLISTL